MHLSDVIHELGEVMFHTEGKMETVDEATRMQWEKGYLWEVALSKAFGEKAAIRIGEVELDGIIGSPDGIDFGEEGEMAVEEYKCTAFSSTKSPADVWKWVMQAKGYCKMVGATKCVFRVLHHIAIMHDPKNAYRVWEMVFTQGELDENWQSVVAMARTMEGYDG